jgi:hypothetical protein
MARVVFTEQQFKDYMRIVLNEEKKNRFTKKILSEALEEMSSEGTNGRMGVEDYVNTVLNDEELLNKAIQYLSPRYSIFYSGSYSKQEKMRIDSFISGAPEIFKGIMSIPARKKIATAIYDAVRLKYRQYF